MVSLLQCSASQDGSTTELCAQAQSAQCVCPFIVHSLEAKWDRETRRKMSKE